jgi:predicted ester cyclase
MFNRKRILLVASLLFLAGFLPIASAQAPSNAEKAKLERNKAIVRGYMEEVLNKGDLAAFDKYFPERFMFNNSEWTKQRVAAMIGSTRAAFPDFRVTIEDQIAEGDKVVTRVTFYGTHQGEFRGIAPTGKPVKYGGVAIDRIVDGKIVEMWHEADMFGLLQQIGAIPPPSPPKK